MTPALRDIEEAVRRFPREPEEKILDWFARVIAVASEESRPRLPYREPGEDSE